VGETNFQALYNYYNWTAVGILPTPTVVSGEGFLPPLVCLFFYRTISQQKLSKCWDKRPGLITLKIPIHTQKASR